jgi:hypothetical protein
MSVRGLLLVSEILVLRFMGSRCLHLTGTCLTTPLVYCGIEQCTVVY